MMYASLLNLALLSSALPAPGISISGMPNLVRRKRVFFGQNPMTSFACCTYDADGTAYTGGSNSKVYVWRDR